MKGAQRILLIALLAVAVQVKGEPRLRCQRFSIGQGLSQSSVSCIIQDRRGFMWFGTEDGLNRFDGYSFLVMRPVPGDVNSLGLSNIVALHEDRAGVIWIGTFNGGLDRYDPWTGKFTHYTHRDGDARSLSHNFVRVIIEDRNGILWLGTDGGGLNRFDRSSGQFTAFRYDPEKPGSISSDSVYALLEDRGGTLWIGTVGGGLNRFNRRTGTFTAWRNVPGRSGGLRHNVVRALAEDGDGGIWIGTFGGGLSRLDKKTGELSTYRYDPRDPTSLSHDQVNALIVDHRGRLWIGTNGGGLDLFNPASRSFSRFGYDANDPVSISNNEILSICEDRGGMIWLGTYGGGLAKFNGDPKPFTTIRTIPGSPAGPGKDLVWALYEDGLGILWIGTQGGGLNRFDRKRQTWTQYGARHGDPFSLSNNRVRVICEDRSGMFWIGTNGGGLNRFDRKSGRFTSFRHDPRDPQSLSHDEIRAIYQDSPGKIWVGTHGGGLSELDPTTGKFTRYRHDPRDPASLANDVIRAIYEDRQGRLWFGTYGGGLDRFDRQTRGFIHHRSDPGNPRGLQSDFIFTICEGASGILWLGTWGGGLVRFSPAEGTFRHFTEADGLPSNSIYGLLQDGAGSLWASTNNGLSCFDPINLKFKNYGEEDGLQSDEFNGGAFFKSRSGEMFFGGISGFSAFSPQQIKDNPRPPAVVITSLRILNREVDLPVPLSEMKRLAFSRKDYLFSFVFAALDFTIPQKNRYAYKLEGFDPDWIYSDARQRIATYTNLSPGHYNFRVKASNNDGVWNEQGAAIAITIRPAFWQTLWFRIGVLLSLMGIAYLFFNRHLENVRLKTELLAAHEAQMSIMPQRDPDLAGFQVSAACLPASEIGGDFFDYIWLDEAHIRFGIVVADVSGKAMKAAMTALLTSGMIYAKADGQHTVAEIVTQLNRSLYLKTERYMFIAMCMAAINIRSRELSFVNAGLSEVIIKRGQHVETVKGSGPHFPLGVNRDSTYVEEKQLLESGDVLLFYTDGLTDIINERSEFFGRDGLVRLLEGMDARGLTALQIKERIIRAVRQFAGEIHLEDDITLVVVKVAD